jgi:hypothetical protein
MDKYILQDNGFNYAFMKNGQLHREIGPALFWKDNKKVEDLLNLADKNLYTLQYKDLNDEEKDSYRTARIVFSRDTVHYHIEGVKYSEENFYSFVKAQNLQKELEGELPIWEIKEKKTKV